MGEARQVEEPQPPDAGTRPADWSWANASWVLARSGRLATSQRGTAGTYLPGGYLRGIEDNVRLTSDKARGTPSAPGVFEKMEREDSEIAAMLRAVTSVLLAAPVRVDAPEDGDERDVEIAEFVGQAWAALDGGPRKFLREALTFISRGFSVFEEVYRRQQDGRLTWWKFAPRLQRTVWRWFLDPKTEELAEVEFYAPFRGENFKYYRLPASALTLFTLGQEGNNFEGISILRPAYTPWLVKRQVLRATSIDVERAGHGFMRFRQTEAGASATQDDIDRFHETALNWRTNAYAHAIVPWGWEMGFEFPAIPLKDRMELLRWLDQQVAKVFLATFFELGLASAGTQALGGTLTEHFMLSSRAIANAVEDALNAAGGTTVNGAIARLVEFNFGPQEHYPKLRIGEVNPDAVRASLDGLFRGLELGAFGPWGNDDQAHARQVVGLPPRTKAGPEPEPEPSPEASSDELPDVGDGGEDVVERPMARTGGADGKGRIYVTDGKGQPFLARRTLLEHERVVAFADLGRLYDRGGEGFADAVRPSLDRGVSGMILRLRKVLGSDRTPEEKIEVVGGLTMAPLTRLEIERAIRDHLLAIAEAAIQDARAEVGRGLARRAGRKAPGAIPPATTRPIIAARASDAEAIASARAMVAAKGLISEFEAAIREGGMQAAQGAGTASQAFRDVAGIVGSRAESTYRRLGASAVGAVIGRAREVGSTEALQEAGIQEVSAVMYSAIMDDATCGPCGDADGKVFPYGGPEYFRLFPPFAECEGRGRCRCIFVYLGAELAAKFGEEE